MQIYGIDLAMEKFDVCYSDSNQKEKHLIVANKFGSILKFLKKLPNNCLLCAEHTGTYGNLLVFLSNQLNIPICLVSGYEIKHSLGLLKGKSDKLDCMRIKEYGERFYDKLTLTEFKSESLQELNELFILRNQLVKERKVLNTHTKANKYNPYNSISAFKNRNRVSLALNESINELEAELLKIIRRYRIKTKFRVKHQC